MTEKKERTTSADVDALLTEVTDAMQTGSLLKDISPKPRKAVREEPRRGSEAEPKSAKTVRIRQIRSGICSPVDQKQTLAGLGLRRLRQEVVRPDTPGTRGQIRKVRHLVQVVGE